MSVLRLTPCDRTGWGSTRDDDRSTVGRDEGGGLRVRRPHEAELALEQVQRRLDNLRAALGPAFQSDDGPRAA